MSDVIKRASDCLCLLPNQCRQLMTLLAVFLAHMSTAGQNDRIYRHNNFLGYQSGKPN